MKNIPIFHNGSPIVITTKEKDFLDHFIASGGDFEESCKAAGLEDRKAKEFMDGPRIGAYIMSKLEQYARTNNVTLDKVLDKLHKIAFEGEDASKVQMKALEMLAHYLGILKPNQVNVGVQVNDNPLEKATDDELEKMIKERTKSDVK